MNLNNIIFALMLICAPMYSVKIGNKDVLKYWMLGFFKKNVLKINKDWIYVQGKFDVKKNMSLFEYQLENGKICYSFFNRCHLTSFKTAKVIAYLEDNGQFCPVSLDCKGTSTEEILSKAPIFSLSNRISLSKYQNFEFHCYPRSLEIRSHQGPYMSKIIEKHTEEHPYFLHQDKEGNKVKILLPSYEEGIMSYNAQRLLVLMDDKRIIEFGINTDYMVPKN